MGSKRALSWVIDHDGVIRRSDAEISDRISSGMSAVTFLCFAKYLDDDDGFVFFRPGGLAIPKEDISLLPHMSHFFKSFMRTASLSEDCHPCWRIVSTVRLFSIPDRVHAFTAVIIISPFAKAGAPKLSVGYQVIDNAYRGNVDGKILEVCLEHVASANHPSFPPPSSSTSHHREMLAAQATSTERTCDLCFCRAKLEAMTCVKPQIPDSALNRSNFFTAQAPALPQDGRGNRSFIICCWASWLLFLQAAIVCKNELMGDCLDLNSLKTAASLFVDRVLVLVLVLVGPRPRPVSPRYRTGESAIHRLLSPPFRASVTFQAAMSSPRARTPEIDGLSPLRVLLTRASVRNILWHVFVVVLTALWARDYSIDPRGIPTSQPRSYASMVHEHGSTPESICSWLAAPQGT
ncbi:hypothetical protein KC356_g88 [Hortaea werneckii]|nr:hypothetical protein KC356_g88 [Hortaea werneckii]